MKGELEPNQPKRGSLTIPVPEDKLAEFLMGLLGRPQILRHSFRRPFIVKKSDLLNLYHLINQRVGQQHISSLVQFRASVWLSDSSSMEMGSLEELELYNETKAQPTVRALLYFSYLIHFPNKKLPEHQEIEIDFRGSYREETDVKGRVRMYADDFRFYETRHSEVELVVRHTARTWANDIDALVTTFITGIERNVEQLRAFMARYNNVVASSLATFLIAMHLIATFLLMQAYAIQSKAILSSTLAAATTPGGRQRVLLEFLATYLARGGWSQIVFFAIAALALAVFLVVLAAVYVSEQQIAHGSSHVILNKKAEEFFEDVEARRNRRWYRYLLALIGSVIVGVAGNYAYFLLGETLHFAH